MTANAAQHLRWENDREWNWANKKAGSGTPDPAFLVICEARYGCGASAVPEKRNRPARAFRLSATHHDRAFFFACPPDTGTQDNRVVPEHGSAAWAITPVQIWPQVDATCNSGAWETRNPMLLFSFVGLSLSLLPDCKLSLLLLNDPPRSPRYEPLSRPGHPCRCCSGPSFSPSAQQR